jgi:hypothetical protein
MQCAYQYFQTLFIMIKYLKSVTALVFVGDESKAPALVLASR